MELNFNFFGYHFLIEICLDAMLRDPYESKMVEINNSGIDGANEGLFAKKNLEVNTTVAFYNGALLRLDTDGDDDDQDSSETNNYKIFDPADMPDGTIDIPLWAQVEKIIFCKHNIDIMSFLVHTWILCNVSPQGKPQL